MSLESALAAKRNRSSKQKEAAIEEVTKESVKRLNVNIPVSKYNAFKGKASTEGVVMSTLVQEWIDEYLSK